MRLDKPTDHIYPTEKSRGQLFWLLHSVEASTSFRDSYTKSQPVMILPRKCASFSGWEQGKEKDILHTDSTSLLSTAVEAHGLLISLSKSHGCPVCITSADKQKLTKVKSSTHSPKLSPVSIWAITALQAWFHNNPRWLRCDEWTPYRGFSTGNELLYRRMLACVLSLVTPKPLSKSHLLYHTPFLNLPYLTHRLLHTGCILRPPPPACLLSAHLLPSSCTMVWEAGQAAQLRQQGPN